MSNLLIEEYDIQRNLFLMLPYSRSEMAELLGIPRPSLSRELVNMQNDGIIEFNRNIIKLLDIEALENLLLS